MKIFLYIYCLPIKNIIIVMFLSVIIWSALSLVFPKKFWQHINILLFALSVAAIFFATILNRSANTTSELILTPFSSFAEAKVQVEIYRSMIMNCLVFMPFGLSLPFALPEKQKYKATLTIVLALAFSFAIEVMQYRFSLGRAETDDVLCNTFGAIFGIHAFISYVFFQRRVNR